MKTYDFTQPGKVPFSQDILKRMQQSYKESIQALTNLADDAVTPVKVSGIVYSAGFPASYSDGWIIYKGELIYFAGGAIPLLAGGDVVMVGISDVATPLTFQDLSTPNVVLEKVAQMYSGPSLTDATNFPFDNMVDYGVQFGRMNRDAAWTDIAIAFTGGAGQADVNGTISYILDRISNMVHLKGSLMISNVANLSVSGYHNFIPAGLPAPSQTRWGQWVNNSPNMKDISNTFLIDSFTYYIHSGGGGMYLWESSGDTTYYINVSGSYFVM